MSIARKDLKNESFKGIATGNKLAAVHPGAVLLADFVEPMGITRYRVAKAIGVHQRRIDEICAGQRGISADTAVRLGMAFGMEPQFWLNLQAGYDLAVAQGGNVDGSVADPVVERHGVFIMGYSNTPALMAADTSALFARNHYNFLSAFWDKEAGKPVLDEEIGNAVRLTQGGAIVNDRLKG